MHLQNTIFPVIPATFILLLCNYVKLDDTVKDTPTNNVPSLNPADISHGLPDVIVFVGRLFEYSLASHEIFGKENVKLKIREVDSHGLPDWIQYNGTAHSLIGVPSSHNTGDTYIEVTTLCGASVDCQVISDVFRLIVKYASLGATGTSTPLQWKYASSAPTAADSALHANVQSLSSVDEHGCGEEVVLASLVLCVDIESLVFREKMTMLKNMADFLSIAVWKLTVMPSSGQKLRAVERGYQILSAGSGPGALCDLDKNVELSWKLSCSTVKHIKDFVKVLQHNLNVGRVEKEVGQPVVGWYVASSDSLETTKKRRRRQIPYRTPIPTPVLQPVTPNVVDETVRESPVISSTPVFTEASEYVPQVMTRQPVIVDENSPFIASSPYPPARPSSWQVVVDQLTPSLYLSSSTFTSSSRYTGIEVESFGTSGETDTLESSYTRVIPTTSRATMIPRVTEHYAPDVFDTTFSGSGSSYVDVWPSVIDTSPISRTYNLPDYSSSSVVAVEATPVVEMFHTSVPSPEAWPEPVFSSSTTKQMLDTSTSEMHRLENSESTMVTEESTTITPEMTDIDFLIPHKPMYTRVYHSPSQHYFSSYSSSQEVTAPYQHQPQSQDILSSSESSGDTVVYVIPEHQMPVSPHFQMSSRFSTEMYHSQVFVPSKSQMVASVASGDEESFSSFVSLMSSAVYIPVGSGSGSGSGSGDGMVKESVVPSRSYPSERLPASTETIEISGSGQMGSGDNVTHPVDRTTPSVTEINHAPTVVIPVSERLIVPLGIFWEFVIPNDVFFDEEDGDVTDLELSLTFMDGRRLPPEYWLQVDKNQRTLTGLLTMSDIDLEHQQVLLVATDSGGLSANTIIHLEFETPSSIMQTHKFDIAFAVDYDEFMSNKKTNLDRLLDRISSYYGDGDSSNIRVTDLRRGSLVLSWNNATLNGMVCDNRTIHRTFTRLMRRGETLRSTFIKHMQPEFHPLFVEYELLGSCITAASGQIIPEYSDSTVPNVVSKEPQVEPEIHPSSASGEGSAPDSTDHLYSAHGSGLSTERVDLVPGVTDRPETASAFGSGGLWTPVYKPGQLSTISPTFTSAVVASSAYINYLPPDLRPDFVTDPLDTTTESSTYAESSTSSSTTEMTTTSSEVTVMTRRQKTGMTSSMEDKTLPWVSVETWTFPVRSTEATDTAPFLEHAIDYIPAHLGKYFEFDIPRGTFYDREDGDTRALKLSLTLLNGQTMPNDFWLQLNTEKQVITGLPLLVDLDVGYHRITLVATDSSGQTVKDAIKLYVNSSSFVRFTHKFVMKFKMDFAAFMNDRTNLHKLLKRISSYFGDMSSDNMVVMDVTMGSLVLSWSNTTLNGDVCYNKTISKIFKRMVRKGELVRPSFLRHLSPDYQLMDVTYELQGACIYTPTTTMHIPTTEASTSGSGLSIWAQVVLPVMIALLVLLLILLIILLINRKRKRQSALQNSEKPVFTNDRNPIIFPEEMEGDEMGLKPKKPIVLPNDRNQSATPSPRTTYYFEDEPQSDHGSNYGTGSRTGSGRRHPKSPPPYYQPHSDPPPYRLPPPYLNNSSDV